MGGDLPDGLTQAMFDEYFKDLHPEPCDQCKGYMEPDDHDRGCPNSDIAQCFHCSGACDAPEQIILVESSEPRTVELCECCAFAFGALEDFGGAFCDHCNERSIEDARVRA